MDYKYKGNDDFRGWLAANNSRFLGFTGNDGRIDYGRVNAMMPQAKYAPSVLYGFKSADDVQKTVNQLYGQWASMKSGKEAGAASRDLAAAIRAQTAAAAANAPRLPTFDILGNYNRAKTQAEQNQRGFYDRIWNDKINQWNAQRQSKEKERNFGLEQNTVANRIAREDNQTNRVRTGEDVTAAIQQINQGETNFQQDEGTQFDTERRALIEAVAGAGLTESGLGQQQIGNAVVTRNIGSERQVAEFETQRQAKELFRNRTFADLARGDLRADEKKLLDDKSINMNFDNYLAELAAEQKASRTSWEADLAGAIAEETGRLSSEGKTSWLAGLAGAGWRPQDIALATQVYGG